MKTWSTPVKDEKRGIVPCCICGSLTFRNNLECEGFKFVRCTSCGLVQMNPQPARDEILARYGSKFGNDYLSYELENEAAFLKLQELALKDAGFYRLEKALLLRAKEPPSVLDIGCATGSLLACLRDRGWRVTGVEISPAAFYAQNERKLDVRSIPLEENNFPSDSFDVILASHLIEHLNDPRLFLTEVRRILKNSGSIFITTPNINGFQARIYKNRWRSAIFDHLYLFSKGTLKKLLKSTGFKHEKICTWGGIATGLAPKPVKKTADFLVKPLQCGDVMVVRAKKADIYFNNTQVAPVPPLADFS